MDEEMDLSSAFTVVVNDLVTFCREEEASPYAMPEAPDLAEDSAEEQEERSRNTRSRSREVCGITIHCFKNG